MSDYDRKPMNIDVNPASGGGGLYFLVGALLVAALVGGYFVVGAPGLHGNMAGAPDRAIDVTVERPSAPATPASRAPAAPRQ